MSLAYKGPYPYMPGSAALHEIEQFSTELATKLNLPLPVEGSGTGISVPAAASSFTLLPGIATAGITLSPALYGPRVLFAATLQGWCEASSVSFHRLRIRITQGDGSLWRSDDLADQLVWKGGSSGSNGIRIALTNYVPVVTGASPIVGRVEYLTPSGTVMTLQYTKLTLTPLRVLTA